jgi:NAD(P)-dependent dehydrogenase (short-subunit alcohol dehydrogenase family)
LLAVTAPVRTIVVTGASAGIGLEAARQLGADGHHLVLVGRDQVRLSDAAEAVRAAGAANVDTFRADFASLDSVRLLARDLLERLERIDALVNNAGTVYSRRTLTDDGLEATFAVNHLAGFLLTELLKERLRCSAPSRVVITSSVAHFNATLDLDDVGFESGYSTMRAYSRSKLANALYARFLAAELAGTGVTVNSVHPGTIATGIWSGAPWFARPFLAVAKRRMLSPGEGGRALTHLAVSPEVKGVTGEYFDRFAARSGSALSRDEALGRRLREESARLVGLPA